jgi:hypothetical protein
MVPQTREREFLTRSNTVLGRKEAMNLPVDGTSSKNMNPFTCALTPPFIGRRRDFYIPKTPSSSKNIPNVNTYKNVFFIQHIYKPATSSHSKPGLFGTITLTLLLRPFVNFSARDFRTGLPTDSRISCPPKFMPLPVEVPGFRVFMTLSLHRFKIPEIPMFANLKLRRSQIPETREFPAPEKHISRTSLNSTFRG